MLDNSGMNCNNYSNTLIDWSANPATPNNRNLGAIGISYGTNALAARTNLTTTRSWTISGDALFNPAPIVVPTNDDRTTILGCNLFLNPLNSTQKLISLDPNGNNFDFDNTAATITNTFVSVLPTQVTTATSGNTGYYQSASGTNTFRLTRRMHSITVPDGYNINGGVLLRVYFLAEDTTFILNDPSPTTTINFGGWLKVKTKDINDIVNGMNTASPELSIPSKIVVPKNIGIENGILYAEFLTDSFSTFVYFAATIQPLPVELTYFNLAKKGRNAKINWGTASELNNDYFEVLRSPNAIDWTVIGQVIGAGNSSLPLEYEYIDRSPMSSINYYRLRQVDFDGISKLLPIDKLIFGNPVNQMTFHPNPMDDVLLISGFDEAPHSIKILNALGRTVKNFSNYSFDDEIIQLDVSHLSNGMYIIVTHSSQGILSSKMIKQ